MVESISATFTERSEPLAMSIGPGGTMTEPLVMNGPRKYLRLYDKNSDFEGSPYAVPSKPRWIRERSALQTRCTGPTGTRASA